MRLVSEMKRAILLTGVKLLKIPRYVYYLIRMVRPDLVPGFYDFGYRYCDPRQSMDGIDFNHSSNLMELKQILARRFHVRQRRRVVFEELNDNLKTKVEVNVEVTAVVKIQALIKTYVLPWEQENSEKSFFDEMFSYHYGP